MRNQLHCVDPRIKEECSTYTIFLRLYKQLKLIYDPSSIFAYNHNRYHYHLPNCRPYKGTVQTNAVMGNTPTTVFKTVTLNCIGSSLNVLKASLFSFCSLPFCRLLLHYYHLNLLARDFKIEQHLSS